MKNTRTKKETKRKGTRTVRTVNIVKEKTGSLKQIRTDKVLKEMLTVLNRKGTGHGKGTDIIKYVSLKTIPLNKVIQTKDVKGLQTRDYPVEYFSDSPRRVIVALYKRETKKAVKVEINSKDKRNIQGRRYYSFKVVPVK